MKKNHHIFLFISLILVIVLLALDPDVQQLFVNHTQLDTIGHFISFFLLTWVVTILVKIPLIPLLFTLIFYAAATELGQLYLGFRNGEVQDFVADTLAILSFMLIKWSIIIYRTE